MGGVGVAEVLEGPAPGCSSYTRAATHVHHTRATQPQGDRWSVRGGSSSRGEWRRWEGRGATFAPVVAGLAQRPRALLPASGTPAPRQGRGWWRAPRSRPAADLQYVCTIGRDGHALRDATSS